MTQQDNLTTLMDKWREKHELQGRERFISDGIVNCEIWNSQQTPKVCFFLKEAHDEEGNGYNLTQELHNSGPWVMWKRVIIWIQAIHNAYEKNYVPYEKYNFENIKKELIDKIAVVNIKKSNGKMQSKNEDLAIYASEDKEELKQEIELIKPDVIVCGSTIQYLRTVLDNKNNHPNDSLFEFWGNRLIINYYHPAWFGLPNRVNYYALMGICQVALLEKEKQ